MENSIENIRKKCIHILLEIDRICKKNNIDYYIYAGTLLGAVRHKGFIPWDDDIDVVMSRHQYNRFLEACKKDMNTECYEVQTIFTDSLTSNPWCKVHDKNTAFLSGHRRDGVMEGIFVDVFPMDNAPNNKIIRKLRGKFIDKINIYYEFRFTKVPETMSLKMKLFRTFIKLSSVISEKSFKEWYENYLQKYNKKDTEYIVYLSNRKYHKKVVKRECFNKVEYMEFEGLEFPAPSGWKNILVNLYGHDYMELPPEEVRVTQHCNVVIDTEKSWREYTTYKRK